MSIRRMTLGAGFRYLMSSVARDDIDREASGLTAYYAACGTPPGAFLGAGLAGLDHGRGVAGGSPVTEEALWRMLGMLCDPVTGEPLGRPVPPASATPLDDSGRPARTSKTVAGFDLTFSAPKSVSVAWALADDPTRARIHAAHAAAVRAVIAYAEEHVFSTRTGHGGIVSQDVRGVVAAGFDHWDSRAGDPQLHTHVVVLNRVQAASDGGWRTLDSKALFRATVGLSELYNSMLADELTRDLGWGWQARQRARSMTPRWEVAGVPEALTTEFSKRSTAIEGHTDELIADFRASHGRGPTTPELWRLRQQATLSTRPEKQRHSLTELVSGWRDRARPIVGIRQEDWVRRLTLALGARPGMLSSAGPELVGPAAKAALDAVAAKRATFNRANVFAEAVRQLAGVRFATVEARVAAVEDVTGLALDAAVRLTPDDTSHVPAELLRADGSPRFLPRDGARYTSRAIMDAEDRLLVAGRATDAPLVDAPLVEAVTARPLPGPTGGALLGRDQAAAVAAVACSGRAVDVLVGAAGTGKSTTMAGVRAVWEAVYGPGSVVGLAPSAAAAEVLADAVGIPTENTTKWLLEHDRQTVRQAELARLDTRLRWAAPSLRSRAMQHRRTQVVNQIDRWGLASGQLVIVDEASMAGTADLDRITAAARAGGAKVLLVGDPAQLSPVQAGGAFGLLVADRGDAAELDVVRRFRHTWEADATLALRGGERSVVDTYNGHGRVQSGPREDILDRLYAAWRADLDAGRESVMVAADAATVADLNARARAHLVAAGLVDPRGTTGAGGVSFGVGDTVVTRHNARDLTAGGRWVKNGDTWTITALHDDGSATLASCGRRGHNVRVPAAYVAEHVELGYASTAHRVQGRTVDVAHAYISATTTREGLYVMATRGRESNELYVDTTYDPDLATAHDQPTERDPAEVLRSVMATSGADLSAHQTRDLETAAASSPSRVAAEGSALHALARERRLITALRAAGVSDAAIDAAKSKDLWRPLMKQALIAERLGIDVPDVVNRARSKPTVDLLSSILSDLDRLVNAGQPHRRETPSHARSGPERQPTLRL